MDARCPPDGGDMPAPGLAALRRGSGVEAVTRLREPRGALRRLLPAAALAVAAWPMLGRGQA